MISGDEPSFSIAIPPSRVTSWAICSPTRISASGTSLSVPRPSLMRGPLARCDRRITAAPRRVRTLTSTSIRSVAIDVLQGQVFHEETALQEENRDDVRREGGEQGKGQRHVQVEPHLHQRLVADVGTDALEHRGFLFEFQARLPP